MASKQEMIQSFSSKRPSAVGVYGYGSGVFKQVYDIENKKVFTDIIFIVDDLKQWHIENMESNPKDYSLMGRVHLNCSSIAKIKGRNNITYFSRIKDEGTFFKYGVIEVEDFLRSLNTWDNLFIAGRFHKAVMEIKSSDEIQSAVEFNKDSALKLACLFSEPVTTVKELFILLCGLSYYGDARMTIAENPNKVKNIVNGSFNELLDMYNLDNDYIKVMKDGIVLINHDVLLSKIPELPTCLFEFLLETGVDYTNLDLARMYIRTYLLCKNKEESKAQIMEGVKTNGIVRSVPYVLSKINKRITKS